MLRFTRQLLRNAKKTYLGMETFFNSLGSKRKCYVCGKTFNHFYRYKKGIKGVPEFRLKLDGVGSDVENFSCIYCGANDRERHLYMFFDRLNLWDAIKKSRILHFAPEKNLRSKISELKPEKYTLADLYPKDDQVQAIDITEMPFNDFTYDFIICNHVIEHVREYKSALKEIWRVLSLNGIVVIQTPYSKLLKNNFEDENINNDELRSYFYGEKDHYRIFSESSLFSDFKDTGFELHLTKNSEYFNDHESYYYGINKREDLILLSKSVNSLL